MTKRLCYLPERAVKAYVHLHRKYGGTGFPDMVLTKAQMTIRTLTKLLNLGDELG